MSIPIGAAVRYFGALGRVVRKSPSQRFRWLRSHVAVVFEGRHEIELINIDRLTYVAQHYDTAVLWEAAHQHEEAA